MRNNERMTDQDRDGLIDLHFQNMVRRHFAGETVQVATRRKVEEMRESIRRAEMIPSRQN